MGKISKTLFISGMLFLIIFSFLDIISDLNGNNSISHILVEVIFIAIGFFAIYISYHNFNAKIIFIRQLKEKNSELNRDYLIFKKKTNVLRRRLRVVFDEQFSSWRLSNSEIEVAFLIIRGFNFNQIASLLHKSERTVRTQAIKIYEKSGLQNRADFTGYFIESIFDLGDETSFFD